MKLLSSFFLLVVPALALASPYPPDYGHQTVRTLSRGPALFAHVGSGIISADIIGYRNSGTLAKHTPKPAYIDAVVTTECERQVGSSKEKITKNTVIKLGLEWHGTGYMSPPHSYYNYVVDMCPQNSLVKVAFTDGHDWDNNNKEDYRYRGMAFRAPDPINNGVTEDKLHEGDYQINLKAWDIIVKKMREGQ
ncbi:MAG: hypothetical protein HY537_15730 [Deltaproteobacteria bacterium]|nr:hypothetical protein [Deltaproteobacteria bacterium]